jgi:hypothetical protein
MIKDLSVSNLPKSLGTLKRHVTKELLLLSIQKKSIPLIVEKLATKTVTRKASGFKDNIPCKDLYFFNLATLYIKFMLLDIVKGMYISMAKYHDSLTKLYYS